MLKGIRFSALLLCMALGLGNMAQAQKAPTGTINGKFSVSADKQVYFSKGNLQYQPSTKTWRFAGHQYDVINEDNQKGYTNQGYKGWIDIFLWGSGYDPIMSIDVYSKNNYDEKPFIDWGTNTISNGGNNKWQTLSVEEWKYLLFHRSTASGIRFAKATVNNVCGLIILPDEWKESFYPLNGVNNNKALLSSNQISKEDWAKLEAKGAVFLPGHTGYYSYHYDQKWYSLDSGDFTFWTSTIGELDFYASRLGINNLYFIDELKFSTRSVRLVCPVK